MINVKTENNDFVISGEFDFGYMGIYKDEQISINCNVEEVREWDVVAERTDNPQECSGEELADILTEYFNDFERKIKDNIKMVNDNFLVRVFSDMEACGNEFWDIEEITNSELVPEDPYEEIYESDVVSDLESEFEDSANDGSVKKSDAEAQLREAFPMFKFDVFLSSINPEYVGLSDGYVSFQCSDKFEAQILCGAYDEIDEKLTFTDWHNF